jgi:peptide/nickel transport system substrate-binding protein
MSPARSRSPITVLLATLLAAIVALAAAAGALAQQDDGPGGEPAGEGEVLRIGWAQDPQTLNPFVALNEENYNVWSLNYDLLVNFSPEDLSPAPGIAESWEVSEDERTVTFKLDPEKVWSDGEPVTSEDVRYSLEVLGGEGDLFAGYTSGIESIRTPDDQTVVIETEEPDARIVGGLFLYIIPEHVWGEEDVDDLTGSFQPELPLVGSGPYIVTEFTRGRIIRMEENPEWRGPEPAFDEVQFVKYGTQDGVERALRLGEIEMILEVAEGSFNRLQSAPDIEVVSAPSPAYTQVGFNLCSEQDCPDAELNPAIQEQEVRQAIAYAVDRDRINEIAAQGTSFEGHGVLPSYYESFYEVPEQDYPYEPETAQRILDEAGWTEDGDGTRTKDGEELSFELLARSESQYTQQAAKLIAEQAAEVGIEFNVSVVSDDKLTELTTRTVDGEPAPEFDAFIWGWGGDPYDPSFILSVITGDEIGGLSDSFWSNPEYDALYEQQAAEFDVEERKRMIGEMVAIAQEELPYLVLTYDPELQAYRTDRLEQIDRVCPADEGGDLICAQVSYEPLLGLQPAGAGGGGDDDGGGGGGAGIVIGIVVAVAVIGGAALLLRSRRRGGSSDEPLEFED